jgi:hypothetical protein
VLIDTDVVGYFQKTKMSLPSSQHFFAAHFHHLCPWILRREYIPRASQVGPESGNHLKPLLTDPDEGSLNAADDSDLEKRETHPGWFFPRVLPSRISKMVSFSVYFLVYSRFRSGLLPG